MQRTLVGILAVTLLILAGVLFQFPSPDETTRMIRGYSVRLGAVFGAIWLAWPQLSSIPAWLAKVLAGSALVIAIRPRAAVFILPALLVMWLIRPRSSKKRKTRGPRPPANRPPTRGRKR